MQEKIMFSSQLKKELNNHKTSFRRERNSKERSNCNSQKKLQNQNSTDSIRIAKKNFKKAVSNNTKIKFL